MANFIANAWGDVCGKDTFAKFTVSCYATARLFSMVENLDTEFETSLFAPEIEVASPGRINLIGEHTDYNKGFVFPAAIDRQIVFGIRENGSSSRCRVYSSDLGKWLHFDLNSVEPSSVEWENYILGVVSGIQKAQRHIRGFDCIIKSDLPIGAGLSSSAAMECGLAFGLDALFDLRLSRIEMALLCQEAEHAYAGTQCGIMDQYASLMGQPGKALLLDCRSTTHEVVTVDLTPYQLVLLNTKVSHNLASGEYNKRRADCFEGVDLLNRKESMQLESLRDLSLEKLRENRSQLPDRIFERCEYVLMENQRVLQARTALENKDLSKFGQLLYDSHEGLRHKYEVSCPELDFLVDFSRDKPYVLGSRMVGGGFGGCTLNLIHEDSVSSYQDEVSRAYMDRFDIKLVAIPVHLATGTHLITDAPAIDKPV